VSRYRPLHTADRSSSRRARAGAFTVGVALVALFGGTAFASWMEDGVGTGTARAVQKQGLVTLAATPSASLYPGGAGDLSLTVQNPNPYPIVITGIDRDDKRQVTPTDCDVTFTSVDGLDDRVDADATTTVVVTGVVTMGFGGAGTCSGQTISIPVYLHGASAPPAGP
jgi:hypothetical protein